MTTTPKIYGMWYDKANKTLVLYHGDAQELKFPVDILVSAHPIGDVNIAEKGKLKVSEVCYTFASGLSHVCKHGDSLMNGGRMFTDVPPVSVR